MPGEERIDEARMDPAVQPAALQANWQVEDGTPRTGNTGTLAHPVPANAPEDGARQYPEIPVDLAEYADAVREDIQKGLCDRFGNSSARHAAVLMQVFCEEAREYAYVYCGRMGREVFGRLRPVFMRAIERNPNFDLRVITESEDVESRELADALRGRGCLRTVDARFTPPPGMPHFAVFDDRMSRMETDRLHRRAIVRTSVPGEGPDGKPIDAEGQRIIRMMRDKFRLIWDKLEPVAEGGV